MSKNKYSLIVNIGDLHDGYIDAYTIQEHGPLLVKYVYEHLVDSKCNEIIFTFPGDLNESVLVYRGQAYKTYNEPPIDSAKFLGEKLYTYIYRVCKDYNNNISSAYRPKLRFEFCAGNHGHFRDHNINIDKETFLKFEQLVQNKCHVGHNNAKQWHNFVVKGCRIHMRHRGAKHTGTPAMRVKLLSWAGEYNAEVIIHAHFHEDLVTRVNRLWTVRSASWKYEDDLGESMALFSPNLLWAFKIYENQENFFGGLDCIDLGLLV